jgi:hypothetical protein
MRTHIPPTTLIKIALITVGSAVTLGAAIMQTPASATTTDRPLTVIQDGTVTGLSPGSAAQGINYTIHNPNSTPRYATAVTISFTDLSYVLSAGTGVGNTFINHPAGGSALGCTATDFAVIAPAALHRHLPTGKTSFIATTNQKTGTIAMRETNVNQDDCQGTTGRLTLSVVE